MQAFLARWKDERVVARSLLQQHSQWLQSFKAQLARAAAKAGSAAATAGAAAAAAVVPGGPGLEALLAGLQGGQAAGQLGTAPVRLQLGGNRELVISVQHN
jgi:hypothetical protein